MNMAARACRHDRKTERFQTSNLIQSRRRSEEGCFTEDHITKATARQEPGERARRLKPSRAVLQLSSRAELNSACWADRMISNVVFLPCLHSVEFNS